MTSDLEMLVLDFASRRGVFISREARYTLGGSWEVEEAVDSLAATGCLSKAPYGIHTGYVISDKGRRTLRGLV